MAATRAQRGAMSATLAKYRPFREMDEALRMRLIRQASHMWATDPDHRTIPTIAANYAAMVTINNPWGDTVEGWEWYARTLEGEAKMADHSVGRPGGPRT